MNSTHHLISSDVVKRVQTVLSADDAKLKKFDFTNTMALKIGPVTIANAPVPYITSEPGFCGKQLSQWKDDVGGLLLKDMKRGDLDRYVEVQVTYNSIALLRRADEDEIPSLVERNILHVRSGDFKFSIIRLRPSNDTYMSRIDGLSPYTEIIPVPDTEDEKIVNEPTSVELF